MLRALSGRASDRRTLHRAAPAILLSTVLVLTGCGEDEPDTAAPAPTVSATTAPPAATPTSDPEPKPTAEDALVVAIAVAGGEISGVEPRTPVPLGSRVRLTVTSDEADEVHVHGFELTEPVSAEKALQLEFVADRPGVFAVELHDSHKVLTRLQVQ